MYNLEKDIEDIMSISEAKLAEKTASATETPLGMDVSEDTMSLSGRLRKAAAALGEEEYNVPVEHVTALLEDF